MPQIEAKIASDKTNLPMLSKERNIDKQNITTHIKEVTYGPQGNKVIVTGARPGNTVSM